MNKKRTNYIITILNVFAIISVYILFFSNNLKMGVIYGPSSVKSIYNSFIVDILIQNVKLIEIIICSIIGILNMVAGIQNRKNKKICFWQMIFGICEIILAIIIIINPIITTLRWIEITICAVIPILLALRNIIFIKKNKPKVIQIISYVVTIIISILVIFDVIDVYWDIICIIMQFIYVYNQEKNIQESKKRKIVNVILYYVVQAIVIIGVFVMIIVAIIIDKVNCSKWGNQVTEILNEIASFSGITKEEEYIVVENNSKYGFINEKGEEKIPCNYDGVSSFYSADINNKKYYFALAKKNNEYYIISKNNQKININDNEYFRKIADYIENEMINTFNNEEKIWTSVPMYSFALQGFTSSKTEIEYQQLTKKLKNDPINLQKDNPELYEGYKLYYENENYTMIIEPMQEGKGYSKYDGTITIEPKCKVTIRKSNGEESSSIEYLPGFTEYEDTIEVLSDGCIVFKSLDEETYGWYDSYGNKVSLPSGYEIKDIINHIIIVYKYDEESNRTEYYFLDSLGRILLKTYDSLEILENTYIVKNENNNMLLYDENLNKISNEYDLIIF